ncbi:MAG: PH domain-containing protein [Clostridia bacterium]|nr:PH domain-containing protein [Clostridia bacterium]
MLEFNKDCIFNLHVADLASCNKNARALMTPEEQLIGVFRTVRDQVIFTDKRIISVDVEGVTGLRQDIFTLPYNKIQYFSVRTTGFLELFADSELTLFFSNGCKCTFEFSDGCDITEIGRNISRCILN